MTSGISRMRLAWVVGAVLILSAVFIFTGMANAQATTTPTSPDPASGIGSPNVCTVFDSLNQSGNPLPGLSGSECSNAPGDPPQCADGIDNDGDGLIDQADAGCSNESDTNEFNVTPPPSTTPENTLALCSDSADDDRDGKKDLADTDCVSFMPTLTVRKIVVNDNGGLATTSDFALMVGTTSVTSGIAQAFLPGTYSVTEATTTASSSTYSASFSGDCDTTGSVTLAVGDTRECVLTNNDEASQATSTDGGGQGTSTPPTSGGSSTPSQTSGGGGGNGPPVGLFNASPVPINGQVLGASSSTVSQEMCSSFLTAFIRPEGANDEQQVRRLQSFLRDYEDAPLTLSGAYDAPSVAAVKSFQAKYAADILAPWGIDAPTGFVYLTTRKKVNELYCNGVQSFPLSLTEQTIIAGGSRGAAESVSPVVSMQRVQESVAKRPVAAAPAVQTVSEAVAMPVSPSAPSVVSVDETVPPAPRGGFMNGLFNFFGRLIGR